MMASTLRPTLKMVATLSRVAPETPCPVGREPGHSGV